MQGEKGTLFDLSRYEVPGKKKRSPQSEAEKRLQEIEALQERDFLNLKNKLTRSQTLTASEAKRLEEYRRRFEQMIGGTRPEHYVRSKEAVAAHFGVTRRTVINWSHRAAPMPQLPNGYDLHDIGLWALREGLISDGSLIPGGMAPGEMEGERNREGGDRAYYETELRRLESELKDHKLQVQRGEVIRRDEVSRAWASRISEVSQGLNYWPTRLPPLLEGKSQGAMRTIIEKEVWEMLDRFTRSGRFCPVAPDLSEE